MNADVFAKTYGMQCIGLRYFNVFGKRQDPNGASCPVKCICVFIFHGNAAVIPLWVKNLIEYKQPVINGDGSYSRDGIYPPSFRRAYINNIIQANEKALFTPKEQVLKGQKEGTWESWKNGRMEKWKNGKLAGWAIAKPKWN